MKLNMRYLVFFIVAIFSVLGTTAREDGSIQAKMIVNGYFFKDDIKLPEDVSHNITMVSDGQKNRLLAYTYDMTLPEEMIKYAIPVEKVFHGKLFLEKYQEQTEMMRITTLSSELSKPVVGEPFPQFCETDIDGNKWTNEDVKGKVMVVNLWYSGCGPCRKEMPILSTWKEMYPNVQFFSATYHDETLTRKITEQHNFTWTHLIESKDMMSWIQGEGFPLTIVVDKNGIVRHLVHGTSEEIRASILECIQQLEQ